MRDCRLDTQDETEEINDYEKHMKWFDECSGGNFVNWYKNKEDLCESEKKVWENCGGKKCFFFVFNGADTAAHSAYDMFHGISI